MNYTADIEIDETALDVEWLNQPQLMFKYTKISAEARRSMDLAKEALELARAEADKAIRKRPQKYGIEKITEASVQNTIPTLQVYKDANKSFIDAQYEFAIARGAVQAIEQRKEALENLVRLHGQSYFAGPSVPRNLNKEWEKKKKQEQSDIATAKVMRRKSK